MLKTTQKRHQGKTPFSYIKDASVDLNLSLPECLMNFVKLLYLLSLRTKSYDLTIQMQALCLYLNKVLKVRLHITYLFLKQLVIVSDVFLLGLLSHENLHSLPEVV